MKKLISLFLVFMLLVTVIPFNALADTDEREVEFSNGYNFKATFSESTKTLTISGEGTLGKIGFDDTFAFNYGNPMEWDENYFYNDKEYQNLSADERKKAELMVKLVRDADKLDLYYLQREEDNIESDPFFCNLPEELKYAPISSKVWEQFETKRTICHKTIRSLSDRILGCISWQFDFNYPLTGKIYRREGYHDMLVRLLDKYCPDKNIIEILK